MHILHRSARFGSLTLAVTSIAREKFKISIPTLSKNFDLVVVGAVETVESDPQHLVPQAFDLIPHLWKKCGKLA